MTKRSCICNRGIPASGPVAPYSKVKHCHKCWLFATDEDYNRSYGGDGVVRPIAGIKPAQKRSAKIEAMLSPPCPYRGDFTGETGTCLGCGGREKTVRFQHCSRFNEPCYVGAQSPKNGRSCMRCPVPKLQLHRDEIPFSGVNHLLYHLLPVRENDVWRWNVNELRARWNRFNGRKIIAVAVGGRFSRTIVQQDHKAKWTLESVHEVKRHLPPDCEVITFENDPNLREVISWRPLWERALSTAGDSDRVFYAHAKGVTRTNPLVRRWSEVMYSVSLDHPELLDRVMNRHPIAGSFRRVGKSFEQSKSAWHYSGSFFWANVGAMKARRWQDIEPHWWGTEAWPGTAFTLEESGLLYLSRSAPHMDLFNPRTWEWVEADYANWLKTNPASLPIAEHA